MTAREYAAGEKLNANMLRGWKSRLKRESDGSGGREDSAAEGIAVEEPTSVRLLERLAPAERREVEDAAARPRRQEAEEVAQIAPRLDAVELAAREQRDEGRIDVAGVVAADERPVPSRARTRRHRRAIRRKRRSLP